MHLRKTMKFLHTVASAGMIGGLLAYGVLLVYAPQDTLSRYADMRQSIMYVSNYVLLPSLGIALVTGLLSMAGASAVPGKALGVDEGAARHRHVRGDARHHRL